MKPEFAIEREVIPSLISYKEDLSRYDKVVIVDTNRAKYQGHAINGSRVLQRKLSNLLRLTRKDKVKVLFK